MVFTYVKSDLFLKKDAMMNYGVIWNCREIFENKDTKSCILNLFETKFAEKFWKARMLNGAFWHYSNLWVYVHLTTLSMKILCCEY